jgi:hypothetical protein
MSAHRREFLKSAAAAWMAAFAGVRRLRAADADIEINPSQPGRQISPHILHATNTIPRQAVVAVSLQLV